MATIASVRESPNNMSMTEAPPEEKTTRKEQLNTETTTTHRISGQGLHPNGSSFVDIPTIHFFYFPRRANYCGPQQILSNSRVSVESILSHKFCFKSLFIRASMSSYDRSAVKRQSKLAISVPQKADTFPEVPTHASLKQGKLSRKKIGTDMGMTSKNEDKDQAAR